MGRPGYRCIFNTETKRYNPRLIGKLHLDQVSLADTNRGSEISRLSPPPLIPRRQGRRAANLFSLVAVFGDSSGCVVYV